MATNKTVPNKQSVSAFLASVTNEQRRKDARAIMKMLSKITGKRATLWGSSIIGYDKYRYVYASGREGDWPMIALSPRAQNLSIYIMPGFDSFQPVLKKLGKHKTAKSCLYIKNLADVDSDILHGLLERAYKKMQAKYE